MAPSYYENRAGNVNLHALVQQLSDNSCDTSQRLINDIPDQFTVATDVRKLSLVLQELLQQVAGRCPDADIRISAKAYHGVVLLHIKEKARLNTPEFACELVKIQEIAEKMGGTLSITSYRNGTTTITFSFINRRYAA